MHKVASDTIVLCVCGYEYMHVMYEFYIYCMYAYRQTHTINMIYIVHNYKGKLTALQYSFPKVPAANWIELDFIGFFAIHGIHQQITLKEGESIIWSRDKLKASQSQIDPVCASVCGIQQITGGKQERREGRKARSVERGT